MAAFGPCVCWILPRSPGSESTHLGQVGRFPDFGPLLPPDCAGAGMEVCPWKWPLLMGLTFCPPAVATQIQEDPLKPGPTQAED